MSILKSVTTGVVQKPYFILIYSANGIGKTTWASRSPNPIFACAESGTDFIDVSRAQIKSAADMETLVAELVSVKHEYKTLVVDSLDWLESLVHEHICKENNWKEIDELPYGRGYNAALSWWKGFSKKLQVLNQKMNVVLIGHSVMRTVHDPHLNEAYERLELKLNNRASGLMRELVDFVLFADWKQTILKEKGANKGKAYANGERVVYTERRPSWDAKSRLPLPFEIPLEWNAFTKACQQAKQTDMKGTKDV